MTVAYPQTSRTFVRELAYVTRPCEREFENGDAIVVRNDDRRLLFAVIDALGHGKHAAEAARLARAVVEESSLDESVQQILERMHLGLAGTRGAAALVCKVEDFRLEGCSVGNVEMRVHGTTVPVVLSPGVLGIRVRTYRVFRAELSENTRIIAHSDGISPRFSARELASLSAEQACQKLLHEHGRPHDDASVLIVGLEG